MWGHRATGEAGAAPQHDDPAAEVAFAAVGRGVIPGTDDIEGPVRPTVPIADRATGLLRFGIGGLGAAIGAAAPSGVELVAGSGRMPMAVMVGSCS